MLALRRNEGVGFVSDDIVIMSDTARVNGNMAWPKIYGYNCIGNAMKSEILAGRGWIDRAHFNIKNRLNSANVRRKMSPDRLYHRVEPASVPLWRALLDPNFGVPAQAKWLFGNGNLFGTQSGAIGVLVFVGAWQFTPFHTLIYQGAARSIPQVLYQAAQIDGAGTVRQFFHITLPQLRNSIITSMILMVVGGLTTFDTVLILTQGGPGTDTTISAYYMYQKAFKGFDFGAGAAIALVLVLVATVISLVVVRLSGYDRMRSTAEGV